jgi:hypothetical protein
MPHRERRWAVFRARRPLTWVSSDIDESAKMAESFTTKSASAVLRDSFVSDNEECGSVLNRRV